MIPPIVETVNVALPPERAFDAFVRRLGAWWPREYTWSGETLERIGIEAHTGGMCYELGPHGFRCDWGRVLELDPPRRIVFSWQIGPTRVPQPDPRRGSEVEVGFRAAEPTGTLVRLEHREFERHGQGAEAYREGMASAEGWPLLLRRFAAACETSAGGREP